MNFPWDKLEKGQGFFVPALDVLAVRQQGMLAAVPLRIRDARALPCIKQGMLGVLFFRVPRERRLQSESSPV